MGSEVHFSKVSLKNKATVFGFLNTAITFLGHKEETVTTPLLPLRFNDLLWNKAVGGSCHTAVSFPWLLSFPSPTQPHNTSASLRWILVFVQPGQTVSNSRWGRELCHMPLILPGFLVLRAPNQPFIFQITKSTHEPYFCSSKKAQS